MAPSPKRSRLETDPIPQTLETVPTPKTLDISVDDYLKVTSESGGAQTSGGQDGFKLDFLCPLEPRALEFLSKASDLLTQYTVELSQKDDHIHRLQAQLAESLEFQSKTSQEHQLTLLELGRKEAQLETLDGELADKSARLEASESSLQEATALREQVDRALASKVEENQVLESQVVRLNSTVLARAGEVTALKEKLEPLAKEKEGLAAKLAEVRKSLKDTARLQMLNACFHAYPDTFDYEKVKPFLRSKDVLPQVRAIAQQEEEEREAARRSSSGTPKT